MPLLTTFGNAGLKSYGGGSIIPGGSALFDAVGDRLALTSPNPATAFAYGTGNFTIEMWLYPTSFSNYGIVWIQSTAVYFYTNINTGQMIFYYGQGTYPIAGAPTLNSWNHIAAVRNGNLATIFVNGIAYSSASITANIGNPNIFPTIGQWRSNDTRYGYRGYITNVKVSKQALYTTNFTPQRTPFTNTSGGSNSTILLLNMRTTATLSTDSSPSPTTFDNNGVTFNTLSPYTEPYVTPPTVVIVSAVVTPSTTTPGEGTAINFTVAGTNTTNGTYYWTIEAGVEGAVTAPDFSGSSLSGSFTITSNSGSFTVTPVRDLLTEGSESFVVFVRQTSTTGTVIGNSAEITINDTSLTPTFTSVPSLVSENVAFSITVNNLGPAGTYFWTILNGTTTNADFTATSGSFTTSTLNGSGTFTVTTAFDYLTDASETFQVQIRETSVSGTVIATTGNITINDTSTTVTASGSPTSFNEGASTTITASATAFPVGTYFWTILNGTTTNADFTAASGSFVVSNGTSGSFTVTAATLGGAEAAETFQVQIRTGSTSGTVIATTGTLTINANAT